jgi:hypothetical protein
MQDTPSHRTNFCDMIDRVGRVRRCYKIYLQGMSRIITYYDKRGGYSLVVRKMNVVRGLGPGGLAVLLVRLANTAPADFIELVLRPASLRD